MAFLTLVLYLISCLPKGWKVEVHFQDDNPVFYVFSSMFVVPNTAAGQPYLRLTLSHDARIKHGMKSAKQKTIDELKTLDW